MKIYIETSVVSFWYDRQTRNREKKRAARRLLLLCRRGIHDGFVSIVVRRELEASREPYRTQDLRLLDRLQLRETPFNTVTYARLIEAYVAEPALARLPASDLEHIAVFTSSPLEALATLNLRHLANQVILNIVRKINHGKGIDKELRVASPEAFLPPPAV